MSLLSRVQQSGGEADLDALRHDRLKTGLRNALVKRLGYQRIAQIADAADTERARADLDVALDAIMNEGDFATMTVQERTELAREVVDDVIGLGPLEAFMTDDNVSEVMVNGTQSLYYESKGCLHQSERVFESDEQIRTVIERIIAPLGRRIDEQSPIVNARLKNGYRVNAVIPPIAVDGPTLTIRKFSSSIASLRELEDYGSLPAWYSWLLSLAVRARQDIAVVGGTGSGKTTLLNALSREIDPVERIVTIEDSAELKFPKGSHVVRLEARGASIEGKGEVTIRDLVINSLRMRPDRIVVGEVRGGEAIDMLQAMNTGHDGSLTTLHAGDAREAILRLVLMARFGIDLPASIIKGQIATALDLIVMTQRMPDGSRVVGDLTAVALAGEDEVALTKLVAFDVDRKSWRLIDEPTFISHAQHMRLVSAQEVAQWRKSVS